MVPALAPKLAKEPNPLSPVTVAATGTVVPTNALSAGATGWALLIVTVSVTSYDWPLLELPEKAEQAPVQA
jgi:hypothetical protein